MLAKRLASAAVAIPVILYIIFLGGLWYSFLIWLIAVIGMREYLKMLQINSKVMNFIGLLGVTAFFTALHLKNLELLLIVITAVFLLSALNLFVRFKRTDIAESAYLIWGLFYVGGLLGFLILIRNSFDFEFTVLIFVVVWLNDTFAYFTGRKWGNKKLAPELSPGKTVEGSIGGLLGPIIFITIFYFIIGDHYPLNLALIIIMTILITVFSQVGDLIESAIKRKLDTKDSGGLIPGHGGILDRFDSIMFAAPFTYFFLLFLLR